MSWSNWTGDQSCAPLERAGPRSLPELVEVVAGAAADGRPVKVVGSGHSFSECALTDGVMVDLGALDKVLDADGELVKVQAGIVLRDLSHALAQRGRAQENLGDIDKQTLAGAISTATHGTGLTLPNISAQVTALELRTGAGEVLELSPENDPEGLLAARVSLGALGVISAVTLRTVPAFKLHRVDRVRDLEDVLASLESDIRGNDHYEFFVFPYDEQRVHDQPQPHRGPGAAARARLTGGLRGAARLLPRRRPVPTHPPLSWPDPAVQPGRRAAGVRGRVRGQQLPCVLERAAFPLHRDGVRAAAGKTGPRRLRRVLEWVARERYPVAFPVEVPDGGRR